MKSPAEVIALHLRAPAHSWSMGVPGAIGEFMYDQAEPIQFETTDGTIGAVTLRGAIQATPNAHTRCIAYLQPSACSNSELQGAAFCLPRTEAELTPHSTLTELGKDESTLSPRENPGILFDLGLGSPHARFCVRVSNESLLSQLREHCGQSVFTADSPVLGAIQRASPARVICSRLGRIEVYGGIPAHGSSSPRGPHTHLLPRLLGKDSLLPPIPRDLVAPLILYPAHPSHDKYGDARPFDQTAHDDFEALMSEFGSND